MSRTLRLLLVEDSEEDAQLLLRELSRGYAVVHKRVENARAMEEAVEQTTWDLVIADWTLPEFSAPQALGVLLKRDIDLPFIIVSGVITEETAVDALKAGAHDFVLKDRLARLMPAVARELREVELRRSARQAREALEQSERLLRQVAESVSDAIVAMGQDGEILFWNPAARRMLAGQHLAQGFSGIWDGHSGLYLPDGQTPCPRKDVALLRALTGESVEAQDLRLAGAETSTLRHVTMSARPLYDDWGNHQGALAVIRYTRVEGIASGGPDVRLALLNPIDASSKVPAKRRTGEKCDREGVYESECACWKVLAIGVGVFPPCEKHDEVEWKLVHVRPVGPG